MRFVLLAAVPLIAFAQQFSAQRASEGSPDALPAWYQMSTKQQMTPGFGFGRNAPSQYERVPSNGNYHNYPSFGANRPLYPDLMGAAQPARRYPNAGQDTPYQTSLARYHQLLLRKQEQMKKNKESTETSIIAEVLPKSLRNIYSTIVPFLQVTTPSPLKSTPTSPRERHTFKWRTVWPKGRTAMLSLKPMPSDRSTTAFSASSRHVEATTASERSFTSTEEATSITPSAPLSFLEYLWPNAELLAAIKDVVAKFKASLDETGLDQDVRLMGNQLRNTWQQLRTGVDRGLQAVKQSAENSIAQSSFGPMNEQLGRLFEKAADDVNQAPNKPLQ